MAFTAVRIVVGMTPTLLVNATTAVQVLLRFISGAFVDLGPSTVTTGHGFEFPTGNNALIAFNLPAGESLYAISSDGPSTVSVLTVPFVGKQ